MMHTGGILRFKPVPITTSFRAEVDMNGWFELVSRRPRRGLAEQMKVGTQGLRKMRAAAVKALSHDDVNNPVPLPGLKW